VAKKEKSCQESLREEKRDAAFGREAGKIILVLREGRLSSEHQRKR